ncbi:MAG: formate dehydrogenase subunit delta [Acetobacteraceae bacterium]|nr:formate dehydrogenase subunit delta [Acetobacteraceae bacterium]
MAHQVDEKLVRMANQIADFFRPYPEGDAIAGVRDHLHAFWTSGMLRSLQARAVANAGGIDPLVQRALSDAPAGDSPLEKEVGSESAGALASDAG